MVPPELYAELLALAFPLGAYRVGVADLQQIAGLPTEPEDLLVPFRRGVALAVRLDDGIVDGLLAPEASYPGEPTPAYAQLYAGANRLLDAMAERIARFLRERGYRARAIPASETLSGERGALSHKAVARAAGLGWIGRNLLLVTPEAGPRVRLSTVLTDAPLPAGEPIVGSCGRCRKCVHACPVGALRPVPYEDYPERAEALDVEACAARLEQFHRQPSIGQPVCGICLAVCPVGRPKRPSAR
ncbi:MAG: 4Fe-4S double cluster binding domain-containing protein [Chloroflexia bacterium]